MKRVLSLLLVLVMLIGMMPIQIFATEGAQQTEAVELVTEPMEAPEEDRMVRGQHFRINCAFAMFICHGNICRSPMAELCRKGFEDRHL